MKKQLFLTNFPRTVFATAKRRLQAGIRDRRERILSDSITGYALLFGRVIPAGFLRGIDPTQRQRGFGHLPVFWAWLAQILETNASCNKAVGLIQGWCQSCGLSVPSSNTAAFCKARQRLKKSFLKKISAKVNQSLAAGIRREHLWHGHTLKSIDGSSVTLMDTEANQKKYPQPSSQKAGCGFPQMGIVGVLNHSHGGWEGFRTCASSTHDARMAPKLARHVGQGDLLLADRAFCTYEFIAMLLEKGADVLMRLHQARHRKLDWRRGKKVSAIERLVTWKKPDRQPPGSSLSKKKWARLPREITLRYIKIGYENRAGEKQMLVVVSSLLDPVKYDAVELSSLYAERWQIELKLRDIKTTLAMEHFAVKTPAMAHKTLWMMMIAYNLVKQQMQQAAQEAGKPLNEMSFKGTLDYLTEQHEALRPLSGKPRKLAERLSGIITVCASKLIDIRPWRQEPRAQKRRPKGYQYLTKPRRIFQEIHHRSNYRKPA